MKRCEKCKTTKPGSEFFKRTISPDGLQKRCKECQNDDRRIRAKTPKFKESVARWQRENPEKMLEYKRRMWAKNPGRASAAAKAWQLRNPEKTKQLGRDKWKKAVSDLSDIYLRQLITKRSTVNPKDVPEELIKLVRVHLLLKRELKKEKA